MFSDVFIVNFEHISHLVLVFLLLTLKDFFMLFVAFLQAAAFSCRTILRI